MRRSRVIRIVAIAVGTLLVWVLLSVGLAVGVVWLLDGAVVPASVAAAVALVAGLVGLVLVAVTLLRTLRGWAKVLAVPWLVLLGVGVYSLSIALASTYVAPTNAVASGAPQGLGGSEVSFTTADGVELAGWWVPSVNGAAVVLRHGSGSDRSSLVAHGRVLAEQGYGVLLADARGHGRSGGRAMDLGWYGDLDTVGAVDFLVAQPGVDPARIGIVGLSMGGEEAIGAAAVDPRLVAVVAEGATGRTRADKAWLSDEYGAAGTVQEMIDRLTYALVELFTDAPAPTALRDAVSTPPARPILLIAAGEVPDEAHVADRLAAAAPASTQVWVVPGAGHTAALSTQPEQWKARVTGFLDTHLAAPSPER